MYIYFKHTKPDYDSDLFFNLVKEFRMGFNKEEYDTEYFHYKADIDIYRPHDLWVIQKMFGDIKISLEFDEGEDECIIV